MKLEEIEALAEAEIGIDMSEMDAASAQTPYIHNKFSKILNREAIALGALEQRLGSLLHDRTQYYLGQGQTEEYEAEPLDIVILAKDVGRWIDADKHIIALRLQIAGQKQKVKYLESLIREINNRTHHIRNAIAFLNFKNGVNRN